MSAIVDRSKWVSLTAARKRSGLSVFQIKNLLERGEVTRLEIPGMKPLISLDDIEKLVSQSYRRHEKREVDVS